MLYLYLIYSGVCGSEPSGFRKFSFRQTGSDLPSLEFRKICGEYYYGFEEDPVYRERQAGRCME